MTDNLDMTLSSDARLEAIGLVLRRILEDLGDGAFDERRYALDSERYQDVPHTTWSELEGLGYVEADHLIGSAGYRLTAEGWIAALRASGQFNTPVQRDRAGTLRAALKDVVKGRPINGAITDFHELTGRTGLPENWIINALASRLMQLLWAWDHLDVHLEHGGRIIRVPARFGSKRLLYEAGPFADP